MNDTPNKPLPSDHSTNPNPSVPTTTHNACLMPQAKPLIYNYHQLQEPWPSPIKQQELCHLPFTEWCKQQTSIQKCQPPLTESGPVGQTLAPETLPLTNKPTTLLSASNCKDHFIHHTVMLDSAAAKLTHVTMVSQWAIITCVDLLHLQALSSSINTRRIHLAPLTAMAVPTGQFPACKCMDWPTLQYYTSQHQKSSFVLHSTHTTAPLAQLACQLSLPNIYQNSTHEQYCSYMEPHYWCIYCQAARHTLLQAWPALAVGAWLDQNWSSLASLASACACTHIPERLLLPTQNPPTSSSYYKCCRQSPWCLHQLACVERPTTPTMTAKNLLTHPHWPIIVWVGVSDQCIGQCPNLISYRSTNSSVEIV